MLGRYELNTIYTGDGLQLIRDVPDESVDLILTDPPFGIGFKYEGYDDDPETYRGLVVSLVEECQRVIKPGGLCFVFQAQLRLREMWSLFPANSRVFASCKNFVQIRQIAVQYAYDPIIFWQKDGEPLREYSGRDYFVSNIANTNNRGLDKADWHECPRPLDVCVYIVDNFCPKDGIVLDMFMGSGTSGVAAKITARRFIGFEIRQEHTIRAMERITNAPAPLLVVQPEQQPLDMGINGKK